MCFLISNCNNSVKLSESTKIHFRKFFSNFKDSTCYAPARALDINLLSDLLKKKKKKAVLDLETSNCC